MAKKEALEIVISKPTEDMFVKQIEFNYEPLKNQLNKRLKEYQGVTYTDAEIAEAKDDRAGLNKFKKLLDDKRKEIKAKILEPFEKFEARVKELIELVDKPVLEIDTQIKTFEQKQRDEKQKQIELVYAENIGELKEVLPFGRIFNLKWSNATTTMKSVTEELTGIISRVRQDLTVIDSLNSEYALQIKDHYLRTLDLSGALAEKARLETMKAKIATVSAPQNVVAEALISKEAQAAESPVSEIPWANVSDKPKEINFVITGTVSTFAFVESFLNANKIKYIKGV